MDSCIFCKIANNALPAKTIYEDDKIIAFHDLHPKAKVHALVIPKKHIKNLFELAETDAALMGYFTVKLKEIATMLDLEAGFRIVVNNGPHSGQEVDHLHYHILGGAQLPRF